MAFSGPRRLAHKVAWFHGAVVDLDAANLRHAATRTAGDHSPGAGDGDTAVALRNGEACAEALPPVQIRRHKAHDLVDKRPRHDKRKEERRDTPLRSLGVTEISLLRPSHTYVHHV